MLDQEPQVGAVSWMAPISQALQKGGIQAAYARCAELKDNGAEEYSFDGDDLVNLTYQLMSVKKLDLAIDVLKLNIHVFPDHIESYTRLASLYLQKGQRAQAKDILEQALAIKPGSAAEALYQMVG